MHFKKLLFASCFYLLTLNLSHAQGTAFTYQGRLNANGTVATGQYDFQFLLWNQVSGGGQIGATNTVTNVPVASGLFLASLDFGNAFDGTARWLDIYVRTNGSTNFIELTPRQSISPTPYAIYAATAGAATTATTAASATAVTGSFNGDVTGTQPATTVARVGGQTATNIATATVAANAATALTTANTIVKRDASGNIAANTNTGTFSGNGANLTSLNAGALTSGTVPAGRLSGTYGNALSLSSGANSYTGNSLYLSGSNTGNTSNPLAYIENTAATGGAPGLRVVNDGSSNTDGALSVSANIQPTGNTGLLAEFGNANYYPTVITNDGTIYAPGFVGSGARLTGITNVAGTRITAQGTGIGLSTNVYMSDKAIYLRNDQNHGLAYNGAGVTNFPNGSVLPDGPVLWGFGGGALGVLNGGAQSMLSWDNNSVTVNNGKPFNATGNVAVSGNLSANNTPGINYTESDNAIPGITISNTTGAILSVTNYKPAPGYFFVSAYVSGNWNGNQIYLELVDTTSGPVRLTYTSAGSGSQGTGYISWVVPITSAGGYQTFSLFAATGSGTANIMTYSFSAIYIPRLND